MIAKVASIALVGMDARPVDVEVNVESNSLPAWFIVGLPSAGVRESQQRIRARSAVGRTHRRGGELQPLRPVHATSRQSSHDRVSARKIVAPLRSWIRSMNVGVIFLPPLTIMP